MANLDKMLEGVLNREGGSMESLVIPNHLSQLKLFGIRQGIEFYPVQDDPAQNRKRFINDLYKSNKLDLFLDRFWDLMLCKGQLLFYLRPTGTSYRIYHFDKDQFKGYYDENGDLIEVVIIYSYKVRHNWGPGQRWVKLRITAQEIGQTQSDAALTFDYDFNSTPMETSANTLGFIPCVVVNNYVTNAGQDGEGEFEWLRSQLEAHDDMLTAMRQNMQFFGNPTLVSTRSVSELIDAGVADGANFIQRPTASSASGFYGSTASTHKQDPFERQSGGGAGFRIRKVVGNVQEGERFGYITPDPVSPDHNRFEGNYRENLHTALGGVDPLGIRTGATAFEVKSLFGRTAATANKKAQHLYTYGLCKVFELAIGAEEHWFKKSIADAFKVPVEVVTDAIAMQLLNTGKLPPNVVGLPPIGDREIAWRWMGPVFEDSPQDILQKSIVVRNLEEEGVDTLQALKFLFSDKTDKELLGMLTGFPFREMQESTGALSQQLNVLQQLMSTPDPMNPGVPIGLTINNMQTIMSCMAHIQKRLSYGSPSDPASSAPYEFTSAPGDANTRLQPGQLPGDGSTGVLPGNANDAAGAAAGILQPGLSSTSPPIPAAANGSGGSVPNPIVSPSAAGGIFPPTGINPNGGISGYGSQPAGVYPQSSQLAQNPGVWGQPAEYSRPLPVPGGTVTGPVSTTGPGTNLPTYGSAPITGIPADLADRPSIIRDLFPTFFNATVDRVKRKRDGKPKRNK